MWEQVIITFSAVVISGVILKNLFLRVRSDTAVINTSALSSQWLAELKARGDEH